MALAFPMSQSAKSRPSSPPAQTCGLSLSTFRVISLLPLFLSVKLPTAYPLSLWLMQPKTNVIVWNRYQVEAHTW